MTDYTAWLVEVNESDGPIYQKFAEDMDDDWTKDHNEACHFARKQDAEQVIAYYGWTRAKAVEHMWPAPAPPELLPCPFCGTTKFLYYSVMKDGGCIECTGCFAHGPPFSNPDARDRSKKAWNRRNDMPSDLPADLGDGLPRLNRGE